MFHDILYGLLLGYGAAVPIGPMNLEMIRRNLSLGTKAGMFFGLGACLVDFTFILLVGLGALVILENDMVMRIIGLFGAFILFWFGWKSLKAHPSSKDEEGRVAKRAYWRHTLDSYMLTMISPFTIIFWVSVSSQAAFLMSSSPHAFFWVAPSVLLATMSWIVGLNVVLSFTRHKISDKVMRTFNICGGLLLIGFGGYGLWHVFL